MISEAIDFEYLLLEKYKAMNIKENELAVILMVDHLIREGNSLITTDNLSIKMNLKMEEIDKILSDLLVRGFIEYVTYGNKTITSLNPLKNKLYREFQISLTKEEVAKTEENSKEQLQNVFQKFESLLGRTLSPVEISKIREWVAFGYSDDTIIEALKQALSKNKKSFNAIDKILLSWSMRDEIEKEGRTAMSEEWQKSLEETIKIAKTPWLDLDDEE